MIRKLCYIKNIKLYNGNIDRDYGKSKFKFLYLKFQNRVLSRRTTQSKNSWNREEEYFRKYSSTFLLIILLYNTVQKWRDSL